MKPAVTALFAALVLTAGAGAQATRPQLQALGFRVPAVPARPAEFQLPRLDGGAPVTLSALKGKVVLLNFWATWCGPCKIEMPSLQRAYTLLRDQGLEVLAIDMMDDTVKARAFVQELKLGFPVLTDAEETVGARYAVSALPTTYLLDRQGRVVARTVGGREWDTPEALAVLRGMLCDEPVAARSP